MHRRETRRVPSAEFPEQSSGERSPPPSTLNNFAHALSYDGIDVSFDVIRKQMRISRDGKPFTDLNAAHASIQSVCERNRLTTAHLTTYLWALARDNSVNFVRDWIRSKSWDRKDRLPEFFELLTVAESFPVELKDVLMRKWLLSAVAAACTDRGFQARGVLVLQGRQSLGKTSFFRSLLPAHLSDCFLPGHHLDPSSKDSLVTAISHWIVELGELDSTFKKDIARLKGALTADVDKVRRPYDRADSEYPRQTVFGASVNEAAFLVDPTGNTRFWTIPVVAIRFRHDIDLQQLYAQLAESFDAGEEWHLTRDEETLLEEHNKAHQATTAVVDLLMTSVKSGPVEDAVPLTAREVLARCGIANPTNPQCREAGAFLRELYGDPKKNNGIFKWRVVLGEPDFDLDPSSTSSAPISRPSDEAF